MASNIGTDCATFHTQGMKPASNDPVEFDWGIRVAENLGHEYYRERMVQVRANAVTGFQKTPAHNAIKLGIYTETTVSPRTSYARVWPCGTLLGPGYENQVAHGTFSIPGASWQVVEGRIDLSHLTNGEYYSLQYFPDQEVLRAAYLIHGSAATY